MKTLWSDTAVLTRLIDAPVLAAFFDFDGTLVPFASTPDQIKVPKDIEPLLSRLSVRDGRTVGLISGRSIADIARHINLPKSIMIAGSHGLEWMIGGQHSAVDLPNGYLPALKRLHDSLQESCRAFPGVSVEWKDLTVSIHLRLVAEAGRKVVAKEITHHIRAHHDGNMVRILAGAWDIDLRPDMPWTKGEAVAHFLRESGVGSENLLYVGDDATDEDVFMMYPGAVTVHVGMTESRAVYNLNSPEEVIRFLTFLVTGQLSR